MSLNTAQLDDLVRLLSEGLNAGDRAVFSRAWIEDRARNIAAALDGTYAMWPLQSDGYHKIRVASGLRQGPMSRTERDKIELLRRRFDFLERRVTDGVGTEGRLNHQRAEASALR